jgi:thioredoxin-related protein
MSTLATRLRTAILPLALLAAAGAAHARDAMDHFFHPFLGDFQAELADAQASGKKGIMVMFHFEECAACKWMKEHILSREDVQAFYRARFVLLPLDTLGSLPITDFRGKAWVEKEFAKSIPIRGTPTFIFYGLDGEPVVKHVGRLPDPTEFILLGDFVANAAYRTQSFAQYKQAKQSRKGS